MFADQCLHQVHDLLHHQHILERVQIQQLENDIRSLHLTLLQDQVQRDLQLLDQAQAQVRGRRHLQLHKEVRHIIHPQDQDHRVLVHILLLVQVVLQELIRQAEVQVLHVAATLHHVVRRQVDQQQLLQEVVRQVVLHIHLLVVRLQVVILLQEVLQVQVVHLHPHLVAHRAQVVVADQEDNM